MIDFESIMKESQEKGLVLWGNPQITYQEDNEYNFILVLNTTAIGDLVAALPVIKYAQERIFYGKNYRILCPEFLHSLLYFIPKEFVGTLEEKIPLYSHVRNLNIAPRSFIDSNEQGFTSYKVQRITPLKLSLSNYASLQLLDTLLPKKLLTYLQYPQLPTINGYENSVLINSTFRSKTRKFNSKLLKNICDGVIKKGLKPVFIGKEELDITDCHPYNKSNFNYEDYGENLINKTSLVDLLQIMQNSYAIMGIDGGLLHLAGMTKIKIIAGFTNVNPKIRRILRSPDCKTYYIEPKTGCKFCQNKEWEPSIDFHFCYKDTYECVENLKAEQFLKYL